MRILTFVLFLCACLLAVQVFQTLTNRIFRPAAARWRIVPPDFTLDEIIRAAARKHQVQPAFVKSIIAAESGFSTAALSPKGAVGLMQLMPETAREFGADPGVPEQNVEAGVHYLRWLSERYAAKKDQLRRVIAAYNAGPGAVDRYHGVPPYRETRHYVTRVLGFFQKYQKDGLMSDAFPLTASVTARRGVGRRHVRQAFTRV